MTRQKKVWFPLAFLLLLFARSAAAIENKPPNIILIFTDDQGYQDLGCFGSKTIKTPHLDRMATEGVRLTSFYAQAVCGVSRAALMTGSYPIRVGEPGNLKRLHTVPHPKEVTMAEVLKSAGYATGIIGKWHLAIDRKDLPTGVDPATMPNAQGFDYFYGTPKYNGFTVYVNEHKIRSPILRNQEVVTKAVESWDNITADYTREAVDWIKAKHQEQKPFFLYLAHNMPHIPLGASKDFKGKSEGGFYGDTIEEIDWSCGEIFGTLKKLNIDDNTLVIFTSDNGPWVETTKGMKPDAKKFIPRDHSGNAEPFRGWKMSAWDGGCRVPFIARWPGRIPAGWESDQMLSTMDLLPTFAKLSGAKLSDRKIDGSDATAFLTANEKTSPRDEYLYYSGCLLTGVRSGKWKLVLPRDEAPAGLGWWGRMIETVPQTTLFDLNTDPGETTNLANQHPEIVASLMKRIERARTELGDIDQTGTGARFFDKGPRKLQVPLKRKPAKRKAAAVDQKEPTVVCFGDSITNRGYPDHLSKLLGVRAVNAGVGGNTTRQALRRMSKDVFTNKPDVVVIFFGTNDSRVDNERVHVSVADYTKNLNAIVDECEEHGAEAVLCTVPPINHEAYFTRHDRDKFEAAGGLPKVLSDYRNAAINVGKMRKIPVVELHRLLKDTPQWLSSDGVHPSKKGNAMIANHVASVVKPFLPAKATSKKTVAQPRL